MTIRIVTDSACDLPQHLIEQHKIVVVPLTIRFGETDYIDGEDFTPKEFWAKCTASPVLPETAAPSPGQFEAAYRRLQSEGATGVLVVSLSSAVSATMQSAEIAARLVGEDTANPISVQVVDSRSVSMGQGIIATSCATKAVQGASLSEVAELAKSLSHRVHVYGALDTLENLKKGGRISGVKGLLASALSIKPIIDVRGGKVEEGGRQRTRSKALAFLIEKVKEHGNISDLAVLQADCDDTDAFLSSLRQVYSGSIEVGDIGAVIGTPAGRGTIGVAFFDTE
jgi:DegV family protein with EDD domain